MFSVVGLRGLGVDIQTVGYRDFRLRGSGFRAAAFRGLVVWVRGFGAWGFQGFGCRVEVLD